MPRVCGTRPRRRCPRSRTPSASADRKSIRLNSSHTVIYTLSLHDALPICRCLMARERSLQVDAAGVRDAAEEALSALKDAQRIRVALTGATKSVGSAREYLDAMVERVQSSLERVERLIATGED